MKKSQSQVADAGKDKRGCEKRIVPKKERPRVYNELKVFLSVIINLQ